MKKETVLLLYLRASVAGQTSLEKCRIVAAKSKASVSSEYLSIIDWEKG